MELSWKMRRRLALILLLVWLPLFVTFVVAVMSSIERLPLWLEVPTYAVLGVAWALPFRFVFRGIGKADPDADVNTKTGENTGGGKENKR